MSISKSVPFSPKVIPAGALGAAFKAALDVTGAVGDSQAIEATISRKLADGSEEVRERVPLRDLDPIVDLTEPNLRIRASAGPSGPDSWHYLGVYGGSPGSASFHVQTPTAGVGQSMIEAFMAAAGLEPYVPPTAPAEPEQGGASPTDLGSATEAPRPPAEVGTRRLRAFISYRFGHADNETAANLVQRFLELENVEVLTGRSYEPRPIHEKVLDRLSGVDFLVLLIGFDGESMWTRDEIATARAGGVAVVPIVTEGSTFEPGLFGNLEYITVVSGHVADAFLPLLEAMIYLRRRS